MGNRWFKKPDDVPAYLSGKKIVPFPQLSELDKQWLELQRQQELVREQAELIAGKE